MTTQLPLALQLTLTILYHVSEDRPRATLQYTFPESIYDKIIPALSDYDITLQDNGAELDISADTWGELTSEISDVHTRVLHNTWISIL